MAESMSPAASGHGAPRYVAARYRLDSPVGRGGAGVVWRGEDELLQRPVAIKEILVPLAGAQNERDAIRARVLREARALARLHSPSIVAVFDVVEEAERHWIVMELVDADSLSEVIKTHGPLPFSQVAAIGLTLADALAAAHSAGVLHRDVKPGNVLLGRDGKVRLTDFGIAATEGDATLTGTGALVGSPAYIAPERVRGASGTPASDLWGLAATLYSAVEGSPPFEGPETYAVLTAVVEGRRRPFRLAGPLRGLLTDLLDRPAAERPGVEEIRRRLAPIARNADPVPAWTAKARHQPSDGVAEGNTGADVLENVVEPAAAEGPGTPPGGMGTAETKVSRGGGPAAAAVGATDALAPAGPAEGGAAGPAASKGEEDALTETSFAAVTGAQASAAWPPGDSGLLPVTGNVGQAPVSGNGKIPRRAAVIAVAAAVAVAGTAIALSGLLGSGEGPQHVIDPVANGSTKPPATVAGEMTTEQATVPDMPQSAGPARTRPPHAVLSPSPTALQTPAEPERTKPVSSQSPRSPSPSPTLSPSPTGDSSPTPTPSVTTTPPLFPLPGRLS